uniref:DRMBL domain-containing protein n=1 Tax=Panagrellus redivivus TaxID=6233 RepID=A0A7E4W066_PANRE
MLLECAFGTRISTLRIIAFTKKVKTVFAYPSLGQKLREIGPLAQDVAHASDPGDIVESELIRYMSHKPALNLMDLAFDPVVDARFNVKEALHPSHHVGWEAERDHCLGKRSQPPVDFVLPSAVCTCAAEKLAVNADFFVPSSFVHFIWTRLNSDEWTVDATPKPQITIYGLPKAAESIILGKSEQCIVHCKRYDGEMAQTHFGMCLAEGYCSEAFDHYVKERSIRQQQAKIVYFPGRCTAEGMCYQNARNRKKASRFLHPLSSPSPLSTLYFDFDTSFHRRTILVYINHRAWLKTLVDWHVIEL